MPKSNIVKALENMEKEDIYSLILFTLYRLKNVSEYSVLSELVYLLDNKSFTRFMSYFEGQTIKIPKIKDLKTIVTTLLFYERKTNTDLPDDKIMEELNVAKPDRGKIIATLNMISGIIQEYDFIKNNKEEEDDDDEW